MFGVRFEKLKILVSQIAYSLRKAPVVGPEFRGSEMLQSGVHFPEEKSSLAWRAKRSSFPALTSACNC
jgi:hypothetical protein